MIELKKLEEMVILSPKPTKNDSKKHYVDNYETIFGKGFYVKTYRDVFGGLRGNYRKFK